MSESLSDFTPPSVGNNIIEEKQKKQNLILEFLNGRNPQDLSDEEFDKLQEMSSNKYFDHRNPEHKTIIENRKTFYAWEAYIASVNDRKHISYLDNDYGLNIYFINRYYYKIPQLASDYSNEDSFLVKLRDETVSIHDRRHIQIPSSIAKIVADPDEPEMTDEAMNNRGIINWGLYAYDLNLHLTIDRREYENLRQTFSFYFALKMSQVDLMDIDIFLGYQLEVSFDNNLAEFTRFLTLLMRRYDTIEFEKSKLNKKNINIKKVIQKEILSEKLIRSVNEWIKMRLALSTQTPKQATVEQNEQQQEESNEEVDKSYMTNAQWVLAYHYGYKYLTGGTEPRGMSNLTDVARFIHLLAQKKPILKTNSSDIYQKLQKAPNFKSDQSLITDLIYVKDLFQKHGIDGVIQLIENEINTAKQEKFNKD